MFTQIWVFSPRFNWGYLFTSTSVLGLCAAQSTSTTSQTPKCYVPSNIPWLYGRLLFFFPSSSGRALSVDCSRSEMCTYPEWVTQLFRTHSLHSYTCQPGKRQYVRLKWPTLKYLKQNKTLSTSILTRSLLRVIPCTCVRHILYTTFIHLRRFLQLLLGYIKYLVHSLNQLKKSLSVQASK